MWASSPGAPRGRVRGAPGEEAHIGRRRGRPGRPTSCPPGLFRRVGPPPRCRQGSRGFGQGAQRW
eukprot:4697446-Lingulodinium_polyedra.AAC.1